MMDTEDYLKEALMMIVDVIEGSMSDIAKEQGWTAIYQIATQALEQTKGDKRA